MINVMEIEGFHAVISFDPEINLFRGEFIDLNGGADFYAADVEALRREGRASLNVFLDMCREDGVEPRRHFSGKFNLRLPPKLHRDLAAAASAEGTSLNAWASDQLRRAVQG
jgi:predicted HicB family RNase H-like nuclease